MRPKRGGCSAILRNLRPRWTDVRGRWREKPPIREVRVHATRPRHHPPLEGRALAPRRRPELLRLPPRAARRRAPARAVEPPARLPALPRAPAGVEARDD